MIGFALALAAAPGAQAQENAAPAAAPVIRQSIEFFPQLDAQRSIGADFYLRGIYDILAWDLVHGSAGVSISLTPLCIDGYFLDIGVENVMGTGLGARIKIMGDQFPEYGRTANTIQPSVFWRWWFFDLAFGVTWRILVIEPAQLWNIFYWPPFMVEAIYYYKIGGMFEIVPGVWSAWISLTNQDEFYVGNMGSFTLRAGCRASISPEWSTSLDVLYRPSGTIALTAVNSIFAVRWGWRVSL
jgi:hypothetical protein